MKILWVTNSPCSSAERGSADIIAGGWMASLEKAVRKDVDLVIAYLSSDMEREDFEYEGVEYHSINPYSSKHYIIFRLKRLLMGSDARDRRILRRLEDIVRAADPDLVHVHGSENCFGLIGRDGGRVPCNGRAVPMAVSLQGITGVWLERYFSGVPAKAAARLASLRSRLMKRSPMRGYRRMRHQAEVEKIILGNTRYIFGRTDFDRIEACRANPEGKYFHVGEIMREPFYIAAGGRATSGRTEGGHGKRDGSGPLRIVSTVSEGLYKGYELLLRTADRLTKAGVAFEWAVIGLAPGDEMTRICEKYTGLDSARLGVGLLGRLAAKDMVPVLDRAEVYCHVSHIENSPNSVCEAMLRGLPVVAADVGGIPSIVEDGVTGLLYPDGDDRACADMIVSLHSDRDRAAAIGEAGRKAAERRHSPETVREELLTAYREILLDY